jgi:hypothetical protein
MFFLYERTLCFFAACLNIELQFFYDQGAWNVFCFLDLDRSSKRSRFLDFFRGRGRPSENDSNGRDPSHMSFIDKTSMK